MILILIAVVFLLTQIADVVTTILAVRAGASEGNPFIAMLIQKIGLIPSLVLTKAVVLLAVGVGFYFLPDWLLSSILAVASVAFIAIVVNNIVVLRSQK